MTSHLDHTHQPLLALSLANRHHSSTTTTTPIHHPLPPHTAQKRDASLIQDSTTSPSNRNFLHVATETLVLPTHGHTRRYAPSSSALSFCALPSSRTAAAHPDAPEPLLGTDARSSITNERDETLAAALGNNFPRHVPKSEKPSPRAPRCRSAEAPKRCSGSWCCCQFPTPFPPPPSL